MPITGQALHVSHRASCRTKIFSMNSNHRTQKWIINLFPLQLADAMLATRLMSAVLDSSNWRINLLEQLHHVSEFERDEVSFFWVEDFLTWSRQLWTQFEMFSGWNESTLSKWFGSFKRISNSSMSFVWEAMTFGEVIWRKKPAKEKKNLIKRPNTFSYYVQRYFSGNFAFDNVKRRILNAFKSKSSLICLSKQINLLIKKKTLCLHL